MEHIIIGFNWDCYRPSATEEQVRDFFFNKYGREPEKAFIDTRMWWVGPLKKSDKRKRR